METELRAENDSRKSFYGKARVSQENGETFLISYITVVAKIDAEGRPHIKGFYSNTTTRHIKEFLKQNGFKAETTKQIENDYVMGEW